MNQSANISTKTYKETKASDFSFSSNKDELSLALGLVQGICAKRTALDATSSVLLKLGAAGELILQATNLDTSLQYSMRIDQASGTPSNILVNGKRIFELLRDLKGSPTLSYDGSRLHINTDSDSGELSLSLATGMVDEFPPFPDKIENIMEVDASTLSQALKRLLPLVPQNSANPSLNGLFIQCIQDKLSFVATDGHCLATLVDKNQSYCSQPQSWTMPKSSALELKKVIEHAPSSGKVIIGVCKSQLVFSGANFNFFTKLIKDPFPSYEKALSKDGFTKGFAKNIEMLSALKRAGCLLTGRFMPSVLQFSKSFIRLSLDNQEVGTLRQTIPVINFDTQEEVTAKFYSPYLLSAIQALESEDVEFWIKSSKLPMFFTEEDGNVSFNYMVMPIVID